MAVLNFYDTSALLLLGENVPQENLYVSIFTLNELEKTKGNMKKTSEVRAQARAVTRLLSQNAFVCNEIDWGAIEKEVVKRAAALENNIDSRIIAEAYLLTPRYDVFFYTGDFCQYLLAQKLYPQLDCTYIGQQSTTRISSGIKFVTPTDDEWEKLYTTVENVFGNYVNEYVVLQDREGKVKDIVRWCGTEYVSLGCEPFINSIYDEQINARNIEQKVYLDALQNPEIGIVNCTARFGCGKTFLAFHSGLAQVEQGYYDKLLYIRNNWEVEGTKDTGALPGSLMEKTQWLLSPLEDLAGDGYILDRLVADQKVEYCHLNFLRGRSLKNCFVLVDEAQNLTRGMIQLIISRLGEGSKLVFCGDYSKQTDNKLFRQDSGVIALVNALLGRKEFTQVRLEKVERSSLSQLADLLD